MRPVGRVSGPSRSANIQPMPRLGVILAELMMLVCLAATAFTHDTVQGVGVRKPDVSDWRAFHRQNDEYWARMVTATTGWRDAPVDHSQIRLTASEVRNMRILAG